MTENDPGVSYHGQGEIPGGEDFGVRAMTEPDMVQHPPHYNKHPKGIECIDVIEDFNNPNLANVVKYAWRVDSGGKWDDVEDLRKAEWYIQREIERRARKNEIPC